MCGINGYINLSNNTYSEHEHVIKQKVEQMNLMVAHRGPDSSEVYQHQSICFGFQRLSIIDLSPDANQPMVSSDGNLVIVFNGEIYNYKEIKKTLRDKHYSFKTNSDTEVILNSYLEYGDDCVQHFNGMWAFAIYDFKHKRLFCSRDRLGVKPFYYVKNQDSLYFSSELKALHAACDLHEANLTKVFEYLAYGYKTNDGETFLSGCSELLPGTNLIYEENTIRLVKYWTLQNNTYQHTNGVTYQEEYMHLFKDAIKLRYRSDVPVALLLSGGLDSSAIARVTDNLIESGEIEQGRVQAFIASFPGYKYDETIIAREFIRTCKHIQLNEMDINSNNIVDELEEIVYGFDHPVASFTSIAHHNIMRECHARGIKVVLNGQGSDEAYAGYDRYIAGVHLLDQLVTPKGKFFQELYPLYKNNGYSFPFLLGQMIKGLLNPRAASYIRAKYQENSLTCLNPELISSHVNKYKSAYKFSFNGGNLNQYLLSQINSQGLSQILHYEDVSSMQQSVEIRSPFLDYRLMEFAFSIPNELKISKGITKVIQRETVGKSLPDNIVLNREKIGFRTPFTDYLINDGKMRAYIQALFHSKVCSERSIWDSKQLSLLFSNAHKYPQFPFWRYINMEIWANKYSISNL